MSKHVDSLFPFLVIFAYSICGTSNEDIRAQVIENGARSAMYRSG